MNLQQTWNHIRQLVKESADKYNDDFDHDLCPWTFDAVELDGALEYIDRVVNEHIQI